MAEWAIMQNTWSGEEAHNVQCEGVWDEPWVHRNGYDYFAYLWCEARFSDGWSHFKLHPTNRVDFITGVWYSGRLHAPRDGWVGCGFYAAIRLSVYSNDDSVSCATGRRVYHAYALVGVDPGGRWECWGGPANGECQRGIAVGDDGVRWRR